MFRKGFVKVRFNIVFTCLLIEETAHFTSISSNKIDLFVFYSRLQKSKDELMWCSFSLRRFGRVAIYIKDRIAGKYIGWLLITSVFGIFTARQLITLLFLTYRTVK